VCCVRKVRAVLREIVLGWTRRQETRWRPLSRSSLSTVDVLYATRHSAAAVNQSSCVDVRWTLSPAGWRSAAVGRSSPTSKLLYFEPGYAVVTASISIRLRFDRRSTAYQRSLSVHWRNTGHCHTSSSHATLTYLFIMPAPNRRGH